MSWRGLLSVLALLLALVVPAALSQAPDLAALDLAVDVYALVPVLFGCVLLYHLAR